VSVERCLAAGCALSPEHAAWLQVGHACVIEQIGEVQARQGWQDADGNFYWPKGFRSRRTFPSMKQEGKCAYHCEVGNLLVAMIHAMGVGAAATNMQRPCRGWSAQTACDTLCLRICLTLEDSFGWGICWRVCPLGRACKWGRRCRQLPRKAGLTREMEHGMAGDRG